MPRGSTNSVTRGMPERENFDREHHPRDFASTEARVEGTSRRNTGRRPPPRRANTLNRADTSEMTGLSHAHYQYVNRASHGHGARRATAGDVYTSDASNSPTSSDDDDDDSDNDTVAGEVNGPRSGVRGTRGPGGITREDYPSIDCDYLAGEPTPRRYGGTRGPRFEGTPARRVLEPSASRGTGSRYANESRDDSTGNAADVDSNYPPRGGRRGAGAGARRGRGSHSGAQHRRGEPSSRRC